MDLSIDFLDRGVLLESMKNDKKRTTKDLTIIIVANDDMKAVKADDLTLDEFNKCYYNLLEILKLR